MNEPARSETLDARAWWTLAVVVAVLLVAYLGLSAGMTRTSHDDRSPGEVPSASPASSAGESATDSSSPSDGTAGSQPLDAESLREFGELGVLPGLLGDFSNVPDCDFDDALSTCQ